MNVWYQSIQAFVKSFGPFFDRSLRPKSRHSEQFVKKLLTILQLIGTNVWLPNTHNVPPEVDFESSRSPTKSESWNSPNLHCLAVFPKWQYCLYSLVWWIYEINRFKRLSDALVHFVMDRASLLTDHRTSRLQFVPGISILEQFESIHVTILKQISFLLLWCGGRQCMELILCRVVESSCLWWNIMTLCHKKWWIFLSSHCGACVNVCEWLRTDGTENNLWKN